MSEQFAAQPASDPLWYKNAVIYEVHVRAFFDSNGDGIGDFPGITSKLDYIQDLGVNTVWVLPFYPSPGRDDGYDISDYLSVHPQYGTLEDVRNFVQEAHRRGLRVITELVINHTSDTHPWFQAARRAPPGAPERDFYVWSDSPEKYAGTRIIFQDTEVSNWSFDPVAKQYYWHRFFSHQPELNFDNPQVVQAIVRIIEYWFDQGVDGMRLDAVPYLIEREGTNNENLPGTHAVLKQIRQAVDTRYTDRMFLAEANQWPEDAREYFGDGDECHMAFHFPLMPRMYMAIAQEDRHPIVEIMEQTPDIPANCQWGIFLRNHDELTLEMVTSRERDYMYKMYAADPRARLNLGIRRRLAPLMQNDPARIKLMNSLLLSMPGAPILYYGDEIGMGDNLFLGDRNGVRTPMQWSPDRNGGFSRADPQQLYCPLIMDAIYGYEAVNAEAQTRDRSSLLHWMRRMLKVRKSSPAFGSGTLRFIRPGNRRVLVYLREYESDVILCVANLASTAQPVEIDLAPFKGTVPVELMDRTTFPPVGELPYLLTLPGYGFYWFQLSKDAQPPAWHGERLPREDLPVLVLSEGWTSFFPERVPPWRAALSTKLRERLETRVIPDYIASQRWYAAKGVPMQRARLGDNGEWQTSRGRWLAGVFETESGGEAALYFIPFAIAYEDGDDSRYQKLQPAAFARIRQQAVVGVLADATLDEDFCRSVVEGIEVGTQIRTEKGVVHLLATQRYPEIRGDASAPLAVSPLSALSSNTSVRVGDMFFLKFYRKLQSGLNPELEIGRYLTETVQFPHIVPVAGSIEYRNAEGTPVALALLQSFVTNQGDGWDYTVNYLNRFLQDRGTSAAAGEDVHGAYVQLVRTLATRTAQLHQALATPTQNPDFAPIPVSEADIRRWRANIGQEARATLDLLARRLAHLPPTVATEGEALLSQREALLQRIETAVAGLPRSQKIRCHGDYHLSQVLLKRNDFIIVDFEGEPGRTMAERREKHSPLRDVATMLRSFSYARWTAFLKSQPQSSEEEQTLRASLDSWERDSRQAFLSAYDSIAQPAGLYDSWDESQGLIQLFELEKALYEVRYELGNRPDWAVIALRSLNALMPQ
jgi:maltose alpha-D-glucosyltransferase / alpha-amylase